MEQKNAFRKILYPLLYVSGFMFMVILAQTFFGRYGNQSLLAWGWLLMHTLPVLLLLLLAFSGDRHPRNSFSPNQVIFYRVIFCVSIFYLVVLVLVLFFQPFGDTEEPTAKQLHATDLVLLALQLFLLLLLLIFNKRKTAGAVAGSGRMEGGRAVVENSVFVSYNHADEAAADVIVSRLRKEGIKVTIDRDAMQAGAAIKTFIEDSVMNTAVTLALVSRKSLLSGWVAYETINTFFLERYLPDKRFIAVYLDKSFLEIRFAVDAVTSIDEKLEAIKTQIREHDRLGIDSRDLNTEKTRLMDLRHNMDSILDRLRTSLCLDVSPGMIEETLPALVASIKGKGGR